MPLLEAATRAKAVPELPARPEAAGGTISKTPGAPPRHGKSGPRRILHAPSAELQGLKDRFLASLVADRAAEDTVKGAHHDVEDLYRFLAERGVARIADLTPELMSDYSLWLRGRVNPRNGRLISTVSVIHRLSGVRTFTRWLASQFILLSDPAEALELPRMPERLPQTILTQEEARKLLDAPDLRSPVGYRDKALLELCYATGIRTSELLKLKLGHFDAKQRTVLVREGKCRKDRLLPLPAITAQYLREYVARVRPGFQAKTDKAEDALFLNWTGRPLKASDLYAVFRKHLKAAGIGKSATPMTLRHSIASHLLENGMGIRSIQEFLGHARLKTTEVYAKVTLTGLRKHYNRHHPKERRKCQ